MARKPPDGNEQIASNLKGENMANCSNPVEVRRDSSLSCNREHFAGSCRLVEFKLYDYIKGKCNKTSWSMNCAINPEGGSGMDGEGLSDLKILNFNPSSKITTSLLVISTSHKEMLLFKLDLNMSVDRNAHFAAGIAIGSSEKHQSCALSKACRGLFVIHYHVDFGTSNQFDTPKDESGAGCHTDYTEPWEDVTGAADAKSVG
eukprot:Gb_26324 [translate_table: standard]